MRVMRGLLTLRPGGVYCVYRHRPIFAKVGKTDLIDVYTQAGDPLGVTCVPKGFVRYTMEQPVDLEVYDTRRIVLYGEQRGDGNYWISRKKCGLYLLTSKCPVFVEGEAYIFPGDDAYLDFLCKWFVKWMFDIEDLEYGKTIPVSLTGELGPSL